MKSEEWKSYRTRFLVNAKQLNSSLSFVDHLGRQHLGRKGDYLVESSDGVLSITPRRIFEDIYVPMPPPQEAYKFDKTSVIESMLEESSIEASMIQASMRKPATSQAQTSRNWKMTNRTAVSGGKMTNRTRLHPMSCDGINLQNFPALEMELPEIQTSEIQTTEVQTLEIQEISLHNSSIGGQPTIPPQAAQPAVVRAQRKLPQLCGGRNSSASPGLM